MTDPMPRVDWQTFRLIVLIVPPVFLVLAACTDSGPTFRWLSGLFAALAIVVIAFGRARVALTLHLVIGLLLASQTCLLHATAEVPNVGIVWFLVVPVMTACLGSRVHLMIWTPFTLAAVVLSWWWARDLPAMAHPLSLPNLLGVVLCAAAASLGILVARERRVRQLTEAYNRSQNLAEDRRRAEQEARRSAESMSRFLASMSHELRAPLTSIVLSSELLADSVQGGEDRDNARSVHRSSTVLLSLIGDVLDLAKADAGKIHVRKDVFELRPLLEDLRLLMAPGFQDGAVRLFLGAGPEMHARYVGDAARIRQVLLNLVSNAIRHTRAGWVCLCVEATAAGVQFTVRDTGSGMPSDEIERIFDPFVQLEGVARHGAPGTGLGLTIAREFARAMGGDIVVASEDGRGTAFTVELPLAAAGRETLGESFASNVAHRSNFVRMAVDEPLPDGVARWLDAWLGVWSAASKRASDSDPDAVPGHDTGAGSSRADVVFDWRRLGSTLGSIASLAKALGTTCAVERLPDVVLPTPDRRGRHRIVVCDDDDSVRVVLKRLLVRLGYEVYAVADGASLLAMLEERAFDLVLLDVQLGNHSGIDVLRRFRSRPTNRHSPAFCVLSGSMLHEKDALAAGADEYLLKPPQLSELSAIAARLVALPRRSDPDALGSSV
ncbi:MAG: hybrid sensor histidine kinase/response regulator [Planctomycetota bacterium]